MKNAFKALVAVCAMSMASGVSASVLLVFDDISNISSPNEAESGYPYQGVFHTILEPRCEH